MERPKVINILAKTALILAVAAVITGVLITFFPYPALKLLTGSPDLNPQSPGTIRTALIMFMICYLPVLIMAAINMNKKQLSHDLALLTIIIVVIGRPLSLLMNLAGNFISIRSDLEGVTLYSRTITVISLISGTLHGIGFMLLICAAAIELYEISRRKKEQGAEGSGKTTD